jgi:two-component system, LytTR family, sensor kinase
MCVGRDAIEDVNVDMLSASDPGVVALLTKFKQPGPLPARRWSSPRKERRRVTADFLGFRAQKPLLARKHLQLTNNAHFCGKLDYLKNNYKIVAFHVVFWLAFLCYTAADDGRHHHDKLSFSLQLSGITALLIAMLVVYANLLLLMPRFYANQKYWRYFFCVVLLLLAGGLISRFLSWQIWLPRERLKGPDNDEPTNFWILARIVSDTAENFPIVAISVLIKFIFDANTREKRWREIEKEKFTAEMGLLKAQINPHFFFNTLNSLYALSLAQSDKSAAVVLRLSDLMRYMLYEATAHTVLLMDEITYLENYIGIEQMRYVERLDLSFQYSGDIAGKWISPLLLLPFVENAFKHGIEDSSGWITIDLKVVGDRLYMKVENSFTVPSKPKKAGLGLVNAKKRLGLAYPGRHELTIRQNDDIYSVALTLQF